MNRSELVAAVAEHTGHTQTAVNGVVDAIFTVVSGEVAKGNKVTIPGWVSFDRTNRAARQGRNPQTGASIRIPASKTVGIKAGKSLKDAIR